MACRLILCVLVASCTLLPDQACAQGQVSPYGYARGPGYGPPPGYAPPGGAPQFASPGPAGYPPPMAAQGGAYYQFAPPEMPTPGVGYYGGDGLVTKRVPEEDSWDEEGPIEQWFATVARNSWLRFEYLNWHIENPGFKFLGAPLANVDDLQSFVVLDPNNFPQQLGTARVATLEEISLRDNNGLRLTFGVPLTIGDFEYSAFILEQAGDNFSSPELPSQVLPPFAQFVATTTFTNGQPGSNVLLYDEAFNVSYQSEVWGTQAEMIFNGYGMPGEGLKIRPLVGLRFLNFREQMTQIGVFNNFRTQPDLITTIDAETNNHLYGPTFGGRVELVHRWFTIGVEPKVGLNLNSYMSRVRTDNVRSEADPEVMTYDEGTKFSLVGELKAYLQVNVTETFQLYGGYNWMYLDVVTRPFDNIYYNDNGPLPTPPGIVNRTRTSEVMVDGWFVGGQIQFR